MKSRSVRIMVFFLAMVVISLSALSTGAHWESEESSVSDGEECLECHVPNDDVAIGAGYTSITIGTREPDTFVKAQVDTTKVAGPKSERYGVLLLTTENQNLSGQGWTILNDPNGTTAHSNYIERYSNDNNILQWQLKNAPGNYTVKVMVLFGSEGDPYYDDKLVNVPISAKITNNPPSLTDPRAILLSDGKTYDFEVTYTDVDFNAPRNISINISGLGSFEMQPKSTGPLNVTRGVTFYHLAPLPPGRYSYHFAAYDGTTWNSTSNRELNAFGEEEELDTAPLILGMIAGIMVISAVYILRKR